MGPKAGNLVLNSSSPHLLLLLLFEPPLTPTPLAKSWVNAFFLGFSLVPCVLRRGVSSVRRRSGNFSRSFFSHQESYENGCQDVNRIPKYGNAREHSGWEEALSFQLCKTIVVSFR